MSDAAREALGRLGVDEALLPELQAGKPVAFNASGAAEGTIAVAQLAEAGGRLRTGIYTIKNIGGGLEDFLSFKAGALEVGKALGANEVELLGIEITNPRLKAILQQRGFSPTTMPVPDTLGGGIFNAISQVIQIK